MISESLLTADVLFGESPSGLGTAESQGNAIGSQRAAGFTKPSCKYYLGSIHLMCAVRPSGPCWGCTDFEAKGLLADDEI
jgi:hypothetical protein